jgi:hypothetical protein
VPGGGCAVRTQSADSPQEPHQAPSASKAANAHEPQNSNVLSRSRRIPRQAAKPAGETRRTDRLVRFKALTCTEHQSEASRREITFAVAPWSPGLKAVVIPVGVQGLTRVLVAQSYLNRLDGRAVADARARVVVTQIVEVD